MFRVFVFNIAAVTPKKLALKSAILSAEEKRRADRFKFSRDYKLYMAGKIMTRQIIGEYFGVKPRDVEFAVDKYGRPHLIYPKVNNFDFNISHSGNFVVLAVSKSRVGIDIERVKPVDLTVAHSCFHPKEVDYLSASANQLETFYTIWTLKESFIKAIGQGLSYPLKSFYFDIDNIDRPRINIPNFQRKIVWHFYLGQVDLNYKLAVCAERAWAANKQCLWQNYDIFNGEK